MTLNVRFCAIKVIFLNNLYYDLNKYMSNISCQIYINHRMNIDLIIILILKLMTRVKCTLLY